ncbi:MAG: helix-turn-helix domain-containing protein [Galactobacter sp.]
MHEHSEIIQHLTRIENRLTQNENLALRQLQTPPEKLAYSVDEAAFAYGLSARTIRDHIANSHLAAKKDGGRLLIGRDELRSWLEALDDA